MLKKRNQKLSYFLILPLASLFTSGCELSGKIIELSESDIPEQIENSTLPEEETTPEIVATPQESSHSESDDENQNQNESESESDPQNDEEIVIKVKKTYIVGNYKNEDPEIKSKRDHKGYDQTGEWHQSSLTGHKDSISRYSSDSSASVSYTVTEIPEGEYCVSIFRVTHPNSIDKALIEVGDHPKIVDYSLDTDKKGWHPVGEFSYQQGEKAEVRISRHEDANTGYLRADEVRWKRLKDGHDCYGAIAKKIKKSGVIDNKKDENAEKPKKDTAGYRQFGKWNQSSLKGHKDSISRYSDDPDAYVTYTAQLQESGDYCISVYRVSHPNSTNSTKISVSQGAISLGRTLIDYSGDYEEDSEWINVGDFTLSSAENVIITLEKNPNGDNGGFLRADATRIKNRPCR